ncbi:MAG: DUF3990 domain-containing protein [Paraprevotella sp.]|nr:DUF3990 domain-containing protein [Paraprevotella sp.]
MIRLYHGSNIAIEQIDLSHSKRGKDLSASALVGELRFKGNHAVQYFFGTPEAVKLLKRIEL